MIGSATILVYYTSANPALMMTTTPSSAFAAPPFPPRPPTWFERKWKWLVPLLILVVLVFFSTFAGGLFYLIASEFRASYPYQLAVKRATESPAVAAKLGKPLHIGWLISGNMNFSGTEGNASFSIPVSGPNGRGRITVVGKKHANHWDFETLELDVSGQDEPIVLLDPALDAYPAATGNST
jgi:hypothetical protein